MSLKQWLNKREIPNWLWITGYILMMLSGILIGNFA
jgi:hypothetical protein